MKNGLLKLVALFLALGSGLSASAASFESKEKSQEALDSLLQETLGEQFQKSSMDTIYAAGPNKTLGCGTTQN